MPHREDIRAFLEGLTFKDSLIIDWGSGSKPVQKYVKHDNCRFIRIDKNDHPEWQPHILANIQSIIDPVEEADAAFCMEVLEHTTNPSQVFKNIRMNLKADGKLYLSVPFMYPEHGEEDYLRFTRFGLKYYATEAGFKDAKVREIEQGYLMEATK